MTEVSTPQIYILYENEDWLKPLAEAFEAKNIPYQGWAVIEGGVDLDKKPPPGVFFNRLSASSHTRGHTGSVQLGGAILAWLEHHGRRVVNGRNVLDLEVRKFDQYALLKGYGIAVPRTVATTGRTALVDAARTFEPPFIVKPNRGGKGLGVRLFESVQELEQEILTGADDIASPDGIQLVQEYIRPKAPRILRNEFIGGEYVYSVEVDTAQGFELCPADSCCIADAKPEEKFKILEGFRHPLEEQYKAVLQAAGIEVAALESIEAEDGTLYTYDINTNTNYNRAAEAARPAVESAYDRLAGFLAGVLEQESALIQQAAE